MWNVNDIDFFLVVEASNCIFMSSQMPVSLSGTYTCLIPALLDASPFV